MKLNWGHKILFLYLGFVVLVLVMVIMAYRHDVPLVSDDYYEKELKYQDDIDELKNAALLTDPLSVQYRADEHVLLINYPKDHTGRISGSIQFMRPSDPKLDIDFQVNAGEDHSQNISTASLKKGLWKLKIYWENAGRKYLEEQDLIL